MGVNVEVEPFINVRGHAAALGCPPPGELALLPGNFETAGSRADLVHDASALTIRAAWSSEGVDESRLEPSGERWPAAQEDAAEWIGPTIFVAASIFSGNPGVVDVALGVVSNYLTDFFRGTPHDQRQARLSIVVESDSGETQRLK